ncbi:MAG: SGNH/GDSL hydrolase family protein [Planctomycetaceae bacterium]|nr:SGNH/GDSL hydrolase family protein [Planctomycetaceae bacterium]
MRFAGNIIFLILCLTSIQFTSLLTAAEDLSQTEVNTRRSLLREADRVLFLGDSITYAGSYVSYFELWLRTQSWLEEMPLVINTGLSSETVSGLSEEGHAGGKFPRPDLAERIDRVLKTTKPDLVFACYGMNCGIYKPFDEDRFAKYQAGIQMLREKVNAAGAKLILVTPPYHDDQVAKLGFSYNAVLDAYSGWLLTLREEGGPVIDLHQAMGAAVTEKRKTDPAFTFQRDGVHPDNAGHWAIAQSLIHWFGGTESAAATSPAAMLAQSEHPEEVIKLQHQQMSVLRDAYLTTAGHLRPGVAKGKSIPDAEKEAAELEKTIHAVFSK